MKRLLAIFVAYWLASSGVAAASVITPQAELLVNGNTVSLGAIWVSEDLKHWRLQALPGPAEVSPIQLISGTGNTDPFVDFAVGFINPFDAPTTFTLTLLLPYIGGPYDQVTLSHDSTVTDNLRTGGGASVSLDTEAHIVSALVDAIVVTGQSTGCSITPPPDTQTCFDGPDSTVAVATGVAGIFGVRLNFVLSEGDSFAAEGRVELVNTAAPEPTAVLLLATGIVAVLRRRLVK